MTVPAVICGKEVMAVVDSAAQVTVVSENFCQKAKLNFKKSETVILKSAAKNGTMEASLVKNASLELGEHVYHWDIFVAPITDELILGLYFLITYGCKVDLSKITWK